MEWHTLIGDCNDGLITEKKCFFWFERDGEIRSVSEIIPDGAVKFYEDRVDIDISKELPEVSGLTFGCKFKFKDDEDKLAISLVSQ